MLTSGGNDLTYVTRLDLTRINSAQLELSLPLILTRYGGIMVVLCDPYRPLEDVDRYTATIGE